MNCFRKIVISLVLVAICTGFSGVVHATSFTNDSFNSDFGGWNGSFVDPYTIVDPGEYTSQFSRVGFNSVAQLENNDTDWIVTLFQSFTVDSLANPTNKLNLLFFIKWQPTDYGMDSVSATLGGIDLLAGATTSQLLSGVDLSVDVTDLAGSFAEVGFTIMDMDLLTPDFLQVDNITFYQAASAPAPVPEPGTILLVTMGLLGIAFVRCRK